MVLQCESLVFLVRIFTGLHVHQSDREYIQEAGHSGPRMGVLGAIKGSQWEKASAFQFTVLGTILIFLNHG